MWEDNDALSVTDVFKMTEVSLNALSALHQIIVLSHRLDLFLKCQVPFVTFQS